MITGHVTAHVITGHVTAHVITGHVTAHVTTAKCQVMYFLSSTASRAVWFANGPMV